MSSFLMLGEFDIRPNVDSFNTFLYHSASYVGQ